MKNLKKFILVLVTFSLLLCMSANVLWAESEASAVEESQSLTADNMNFDVIFAIDGSGSMKKSDTLKLRLSAGRLFTELAASDTSRVGYVQFTNVIMESSELTDLASEKNKESFRNKLLGLKDAVKGTWDTDISLGLTEALRLLKEGGSFGNDRNPVIILLSDGNTDLPSGPRTVEESNEELKTTLAEAAELGVPIYSIGLNWDGKLDIDYMENIANETGGKFYNITTASEFNEYMTQIFGNVADGESTSLTPEYKDGRYYTKFVIDNSSVLTANIVILTDKGVSAPELTDPSGNDVTLDEEHGVIVTTDISDENHTSTYTILKIMYPEQGVWQVSVKGEADDAVKINLLTTYDISFVISGEEGVIAGNDVTFTGYLTRADEVIKDNDLLEGASAKCTIMDNKGNVIGENLPMTLDEENVVFTYTTPLEKSGNYYVTASLEGRDESFSKQSSQYQLTVERIPITVSGSFESSMWCSPITTTASFNLGEKVSCESLSGLECTVENQEGSIVTVSYDKDTGNVTLTPKNTGKQTLTLLVSDEYGQSEKVDVNITVHPSWIWFVAGAGILLILILIILIIKIITKPVLKEPVTVELALPPMLMNLTPSPVTMAMPSKKSEAILGKLLQSDQMAQSTFSEPIMRANLAPFLEKVKLKAEKGGNVSVKIMPKVQGVVVINNQNVDTKKGGEYPLRKNDKLGIQFSVDGVNSSIVYLKLGKDTGGWDNAGGPFGGNGSSFGDNSFGSPFGGGQSGFGSSFGGGQSGFGSPFGGGQSGFGSTFGGGQSGFGGNGSSENGNAGFGGFGGSGNRSGNGNSGDFGSFGGSGNGNSGDFGSFGGSGNGNSGETGNFGNFDDTVGNPSEQENMNSGQRNNEFNFGGEDTGVQNDSDDSFGGFF